MADLSEYLKGEKPPQLEVPTAEVPQQEAQASPEPAKDDRPRDETGRFVKGEDKAAAKVEAEPKEAAPPAAKVEPKAKPPEVSGLEAGIAAERRQRQAAEKRAMELEARMREIEQRANPPAPPPDVAQDPQGFATHVQATQQAVVMNERLNVSEMLARDKHGDEAVEAAQQAFIETAQADPTLWQQLHTQRNPYGWLMKWQQQRQFMSEVGDDPAAYRQKLEAEIRAKVESEFAQQRQPVVTPPPSLASARSNGRMSEPVWSGPPPLSSAFKR